MDIHNARIYDHGVQIVLTNNRSGFIHFDENSGRIVERLKINTISDVKHTGIWLGKDQNGTVYILHNHYLRGYAHLSTYREYAKNQKVDFQAGNCSNDWLTVIEIGLKNAIDKRPYHLPSYNCQTYTNEACHNKSFSQDINKWAGLGFIFGIGIAIAAIVSD